MIAEVVETKWAYKDNQKDYDGNPLPLGSIEIRIGSHQSNLGQVRNIFARPAGYNQRIPLIGEQVMIMPAPVNDWSSAGIKNSGYIYFNPINATDDLVLHAFPKLFKRSNNIGNSEGGERKHDKGEFGYTFPKSPKRVYPLQPFDGDEILQGRFGQSIRFGSTVQGDMSVYSKKPTWNGGENTDPLIIIRVKKPSGGNINFIDPVKINKSTNKYTIESIDDDDSSIYITSKQKITLLKAGFAKNTNAKGIGSWSAGSQIILNSDRLVLNAKTDSCLMIAKNDAIITAKNILFQSDKYKVDLDDLMDFLKKWLDEDKKLSQGTAQYSTPSGPTAVSTNLSEYIKLTTTDFQKFKMP